MWFVDCQEEDLSSRTGDQFYLEKNINKTEFEKIVTCARIEIGQYAGNTDQKVKWFLKVRKTYKLLWEAYFQFSFFPSFYSGSYFTKFSIFSLSPSPPKIRVKLRN